VTGPNLSEWALNHRSFVIFMMIAVTAAGLTSYFRLGRSEDPAFTFRTMIVQASWPGATLDDTLQQVTERLERSYQIASRETFWYDSRFAQKQARRDTKRG
jgi:multidrug efflux pump subunit AcrB